MIKETDMRYAVASLDVLGNQNEGFDINDQTQIGSVDLSLEAAEDDQAILNVLNQLEYLENASLDDVSIEGEDLSYLLIVENETGRPLLSLILEQ